MLQSDSARPWRYALASAIGTSHERSGLPCQDASACEVFSPAGASVFVAVVSDGAGSAPQSQVGARLACHVWRDEAERALASGCGVSGLDRAFAHASLRRFRVLLARLARRADRPVRDYACTLLFAAVDEHASSFAQVGDGAIVVSACREGSDGPAGFRWVFWPQQGEYVNQTVFATEARADDELQFEQRLEPVDEVALFSDGLQGLVLDARARTAHARFFEPMFAAVRGAEPGRSEALCRSLQRFLASRAIVSRTDDDKSLVLASRRTPAPAPALPAPGLPEVPAASGAPSLPAEPRG